MSRLALALLLMTALPARAADPVLRVQTRTRVELSSLTRAQGFLIIRGRYLDTAIEQAIPNHTVAISIDPEAGTPYQYAVPTGADGTFEWRVKVPLGRYTLRIGAGGDRDYAPATPLFRQLDIARRTPVVTLSAPEQISVEQRHVTITVETHEPEDELDGAATVPVDLAVTLSAGGAETIVHTHRGRAELEQAVAPLGPPGTLAQITARFDGDANRNRAEATRAIRVTTPTTLTLSADGNELPANGTLALAGELTDARGPVAAQTIALWAGPRDDDLREVAEAVTDERGRFRVELRGGRVRAGVNFVEARYAPPMSWREPSRSPALTVNALPPEPRSLAFYISPILTALVLGLIALARRRPWRVVAERRARARPNSPGTAVGLTENRPRLLSALRPPTDHGFTGQVCEAPSQEPVPIALVAATASDGVTRTVTVDEHGGFAIEDLPAGPLTVEVGARGYVSERFERALPHRGELRGARILLVPIRARIFARYREATLPFLPSPAAAETWTPRELLDHVRRRALLVDELQALTTLVEEAYFSPRAPDGDALAETERLSAAVAARAPRLDPPRARSL